MIRIATVALAALVFGACGSVAEETPSLGTLGVAGRGPSASLAPGQTAIPESPIVGVVTGVDSAGLDQVRGFTLRANDGSSITFDLGQLENGDEFPPGHLKEHQATASPILVFFRSDSGRLVAYRLEDAG